MSEELAAEYGFHRGSRKMWNLSRTWFLAYRPVPTSCMRNPFCGSLCFITRFFAHRRPGENFGDAGWSLDVIKIEDGIVADSITVMVILFCCNWSGLNSYWIWFGRQNVNDFIANGGASLLGAFDLLISALSSCLNIYGKCIRQLGGHGPGRCHGNIRILLLHPFHCSKS